MDRVMPRYQVAKIPQPLSEGEEELALHLRHQGIEYEREYRFSERRWRADFALLEHRILIEVEGGTHSAGRHVRGKGYEADCEKYNAAVLAGWRVLRFTTQMVRQGTAIAIIMALLTQPEVAP
jgi:very-short-patch-repair endonuclease